MPFYKWLLGHENTLSTADMQSIDSALSKTVVEMEKIAQQKLRIVSGVDGERLGQQFFKIGCH